MKTTGYQYQSCFSSYIEMFILEKRASGFIYESEEWKLKNFDAFCIAESVTEPRLDRELVKKWGTLRDGEALVTCSARISVIRQFALFLTALGMEAYIPSRYYKAEKTVVHILSDNEIAAFFEEVDAYTPMVRITSFYRLATEYKVIFRLIYCCGLRISEARKLSWKDVNLKQGTLRLLQSKGHKDRLVYMAGDLTELMRTYKETLYEKHHCMSDWVFPAREVERCLSNGTIDKKFREFWNLTPYAERCDKTPTVHCLRHTFVVKRMNLWMEEGVPLKEMLPFLSRYLGHQSPDETFYYYHQVAEAFRIIREKDRTGEFVIPEVDAYE
ncbi:MAG: tyrosine-type recombinase/integrase [Clostridiales bacterium]|nr:tyrosine-type recombinase/integrase [Clostridiales bacterium]